MYPQANAGTENSLASGEGGGKKLWRVEMRSSGVKRVNIRVSSGQIKSINKSQGVKDGHN